MKRFIFITALAIMFSAGAYAHTAFTLVSSQKKTVKQSELVQLEKQRTLGRKEGSNLTFTAKEVRLVVTTGPEDDMFSYRIQGVRNPNLVVPAGATLKILFINTDTDMRHDVRFGHFPGEFAIAVDITGTAGSTKLAARADVRTLQAEEVVLRAAGNGQHKYFCSVRGHAKGGMWGNILVGVKPGAGLKTAPKTEHIHSPDEDHDKPAAPADPKAPPAKPAERAHDPANPAPTKPAEHAHDPAKPAPVKPVEHAHDPAVAARDHATPAPSPAETKKLDEHQQHAEAAAGDDPAMAGMDHGAHNAEMMRSNINIGEPMSREGSGTSWLPDSSPMHAYMKMFKDGGILMLHGTMFARYTSIGSSRDVSVAGKGSRNRFDAPSMFMAMYSKPINEKSQFGLRAMFSLDPLIERGYGYPLLYQSGELYRGEQLHDRQHPHELFSELAATYSYKFDDKNSFYFYAGYPGEPALGPPVFMHRPSGMNNPDAPIGHHWQDATHITMGVLTAGFTHDKIKFEVSAFNGTEPDENRWVNDPLKLNSFSGRLSYNPTREWSFQISHGYLEYPERSEPELKVLRKTTASAIYNKTFSNNKNWANSFVWGQNATHESRTNAFLYESNYDFGKNAIFGRLEQVQKNAHELVLEAPHPEGNFWVGAYSVGYLREIVKDKGIDVGLGGMATFNTNPASIAPFYGGTKHGGWQVFMRFRPSKRH